MLFVGDDWAEDKHDVELQAESGRVLARATLREGVDGIARLHAMVGEQIGDDDDADVVVGIETERGPWVQALIAAGYTVYAINPLQVARARDRHGVSGGKSDTKDAHVLADLVRTDRHQLRPVAAVGIPECRVQGGALAAGGRFRVVGPEALIRVTGWTVVILGPVAAGG